MDVRLFTFFGGGRREWACTLTRDMVLPWLPRIGDTILDLIPIDPDEQSYGAESGLDVEQVFYDPRSGRFYVQVEEPIEDSRSWSDEELASFKGGILGLGWVESSGGIEGDWI